MKNQLIPIALVTMILCSCGKENESALNLFAGKDAIQLVANSSHFEKDALANPYLIMKIDSFIIVHDMYEMQHFSVFNAVSGKYLTRFGNIGNGPGELLTGNVLSIYRKNLYSFDIPRRYIFKYNVEALINDEASRPETVGKFADIPDAYFSRILPVDSACFLGGGVYKSQYQHLLMNEKGEITDYGIDIFNKQESFNDVYKFLSNQGILVNHPDRAKFVYSVSNSSNIDFFEVTDQKLHPTKSYRLHNPAFKNENIGRESYSIEYKDDAIIGYIDLSSTHEYVYALYTDRTRIDKNGRENPYASNIILVFDWDGNPDKIYQLDREVYYIAVDENNKILYALLKDAEKDWVIASFNCN
jgi:hypothetical protein